MPAQHEVARSNEYNEESIKEISREDIKTVEEFKDYYNQASEDEKQQLNQEFADNVQKELDKNPELKSEIEWDNVDSEVRESDVEKVDMLNDLQNSLKNYPDIPNANREAINTMVYGTMKETERAISNVLDQSEKPRDEKIEA